MIFGDILCIFIFYDFDVASWYFTILKNFVLGVILSVILGVILGVFSLISSTLYIKFPASISTAITLNTIYTSTTVFIEKLEYAFIFLHFGQ